MRTTFQGSMFSSFATASSWQAVIITLETFANEIPIPCVFPMYLMDEARDEIVFAGLKNPFYAVDSRDFQVIEPNYSLLTARGGKILALEKERPHVPLERAIMAIRFNEYFIGTQFHPEADAVGMSMYLQREDKKKGIVANYGEAKWSSMIEQLNDPDKILFTYSHILPNFLNHAVEQLVEA